MRHRASVCARWHPRRLASDRRLGEAVVVVGAFTALALVMTYPLVRHITEALPNDLGDPLLNAWILA